MHRSLRPALLLVFIDLLFNLVIWMMLSVNPEIKDNKDQAKSDAIYTVYMTWETGLDVDVDMWLALPNGARIAYNNKDAGYITLERDDLGAFAGQGDLNLEILKFREPPDGQYGISIHTYSAREQPEGQVTIEMYDASGGLVYQRSVPMPKVGSQTGVALFEFNNRVLTNPRDGELVFRGT